MGSVSRRRERAYKLVLVECGDSAGCPAGWHFADDVVPATVVVHSARWLLKDPKEYKFLAPHVNPKKGAEDRPQIAGYITIPRGAVRRQVLLTSSSRNRRSGPA